MIRTAAALIAAIGLAACLPGAAFQPQGDAIARLLAGRSVTCDLPDGALGQRERQVLRADGTTTFSGRAALRDGALNARDGIWWVGGNRYCSTFSTYGTRDETKPCYFVTVSDGGRRVRFQGMRERVFDIFDIDRDWSGIRDG
jgi:hypothetical protein